MFLIMFQVKSPSIPQLPQYRDLYNALSPYHSKLVGESYLAKKRPVYECTDVQVSDVSLSFSLFALDIRRTIFNHLSSIVCFYNQKVEAAKGFLDVLRLYLDSLCSNLQSHTITNVQSNNDKVCFFSQKISILEAFWDNNMFCYLVRFHFS